MVVTAMTLKRLPNLFLVLLIPIFILLPLLHSTPTPPSPSCYPFRPTIVPSASPINYCQAPFLRHHTLFMNYGACCFGKRPSIWEGIIAVQYGSDPTYIPLYGADNWGTETRDEHEMAFPFVYQNTVIFAATRWSLQPPGRVGIGLYNLVDRTYNWDWLRLPGIDIFPIGITSSHIFARIGDNKIVRFSYSDNTPNLTYSYLTMAGPFGTLVPTFDHVAIGQDGQHYALRSTGWIDRPGDTVEWVSPNGLTEWTATGRTWPAKSYPTWQATYAMTLNDTIQEPRLILYNCGDGQQADKDTWGFGYYAESVFSLPPYFPLEPTSPEPTPTPTPPPPTPTPTPQTDTLIFEGNLTWLAFMCGPNRCTLRIVTEGKDTVTLEYSPYGFWSTDMIGLPAKVYVKNTLWVVLLDNGAVVFPALEEQDD